MRYWLVCSLVWIGCEGSLPPFAIAPPKSPALLASSYYLVMDSDGKTPEGGTDVVLIFEPSGVADLYLAGDTSAVAYRGRYQYDGATARVKFDRPDFHPDVSFALAPDDDLPTLPFRALSTGGGSSTWQRHVEPIDHNIYIAYNMSLFADGKDADTAIDDALSYATALAQTAPAAETASIGTASLPSYIAYVERIPHGLRIHRTRQLGTPSDSFDLILYDWLGADEGVPIMPGPFHSDPRLTLPTNSPLVSNAGDPKEKTALFIMPFKSQRHGAYLVPDKPGGSLRVPGNLVIAETGWDDEDHADEMVQRLTERGYRVELLADGQANIVQIIQELLPTATPLPDNKIARAKSPSLIFFHTHGGPDGGLATGELLTPTPTPPKTVGVFDNYDQPIADFFSRIQATYPDLLTVPKQAFYSQGVFEGPKASSGVRYIAVQPAFWDWLRSRGADFNESLVFIGACETDTEQNHELRDAILSRAYFAYSGLVHSFMVGKTFRFLIEHLANHGRTAEEFFYNTLRVLNTKQTEYCEDDVFYGVFGTQVPCSKLTDGECAPAAKFVLESFQGYGLVGSGMVSYRDKGWLNTANADLGAIWWLLFAGRWSQTAEQGKTILENCWHNFWDPAVNLDDITDLGCHAMNPGRTPTAQEIDYASYLLTGSPLLNVVTFRQPRWTLNDGGADTQLKLGCCPPGPDQAPGICTQ